jgi:hypothetical protein
MTSQTDEEAARAAEQEVQDEDQPVDDDLGELVLAAAIVFLFLWAMSRVPVKQRKGFE